MPNTTHLAYTQALTSALTTELNTLATATNTAASSAIDNTTNLDLYVDIVLTLGTSGGTRTAGGPVTVYLLRSIDGGTLYDRITSDGSVGKVAAVWALDAATTAGDYVECDIPIPPGFFKFVVRNATGQNFAASANTLKYRTHSLKTV